MMGRNNFFFFFKIIENRGLWEQPKRRVAYFKRSGMQLRATLLKAGLEKKEKKPTEEILLGENYQN